MRGRPFHLQLTILKVQEGRPHARVEVSAPNTGVHRICDAVLHSSERRQRPPSSQVSRLSCTYS